MAGEEIVETPEVVEPIVEAVEPEVAEAPHPLKPGGVRFEDIYARMKQSEEREREKDARIARLEGAMQATQRPQGQQRMPVYTPQQLQAAVDAGQISPMQASDIISRQNATATALQMAAAQVHGTRIQSASAEVQAYINKIPKLGDPNSAEFARVSKEAYRIADDLNVPVTDARVQRVALRAVYGSLDRIAANDSARSASREASLPHTETGVGGTGRPAAPKADDALKGISQKYIDFWTKKGYSRERMVQEAKYVTKEPRSHPVNR